MRTGGIALEELLHVLVNQRVVDEVFTEGVLLLLVWQFAIDEEIGDIWKFELRCQFFDWIASVTKNALFPIDKGDSTLARAGVAVARVDRNETGCGPQFRDVDADFAL